MSARTPKGSKSTPGRSAKPAVLKVLHGQKPAAGTIVPGTGEVKPPAHLDGPALAEWNRLAPDLIRRGLLTHWDTETFSIYCEAVAAREETWHELKARPLVPGRNGLLVKNPAHQLWREYSLVVMAAAARFGMTPADRSNVTMPPSVSDADALFSK